MACARARAWNLLTAAFETCAGGDTVVQVIVWHEMASWLPLLSEYRDVITRIIEPIVPDNHGKQDLTADRGRLSFEREKCTVA